MPVTLVITDLDVGGAERALVALATGLDRRRWEVSVVALGAWGELADVLRGQGIETTCLGLSARNPVSGVSNLAAVLRQRGPRLVQSFLFHANIMSRLAATMAGRPWVVTGLRVAEREKRWHLKVDRLTSRLSAGAVCVSQGVLRFSVEEAGLDPARLVVIPNGVDSTLIERAARADRKLLGVTDEAHVALFVGRMEKQKGLDELLEAARVVASGRPAWNLFLVGDGPLRGEIHGRLSRDSVLEAHVHFMGRRGDVPSLLKAADVLVLPSRWEGMPNVVLEAMAAGLAVVGTAVEGTEDLVIPGETGWLVPVGDVVGLEAALIEASDKPEERRKRGEAGRERVRRHFSQERVVAAYDRLWTAVLGYVED